MLSFLVLLFLLACSRFIFNRLRTEPTFKNRDDDSLSGTFLKRSSFHSSGEVRISSRSNNKFPIRRLFCLFENSPVRLYLLNRFVCSCRRVYIYPLLQQKLSTETIIIFFYTR